MDEKIHEMNINELIDRCMAEINNYRRGMPSNDAYGLELFRRALHECDSSAWDTIQLHFTAMMLQWMRRHPLRNAACNYDSEENYAALAFARFWQATIENQQLQFRSLASILRYLQASLNGTILDTLRTYSRPREVALLETDEAEPVMEDQEDSYEVWKVIQSILANERQQRVAYLIFHCGLKPREIVQFCSQEFSDIHEIYRLKRSVTERLQRNADYLRWRLDYQLQ